MNFSMRFWGPSFTVGLMLLIAIPAEARKKAFHIDRNHVVRAQGKVKPLPTPRPPEAPPRQKTD